MKLTGVDAPQPALFEAPLTRSGRFAMVRSADGASKTCTLCGRMKRLVEYPLSKHTNDGRKYWCKPCHVNVNAAQTVAIRMEVFTHYSGGTPRCACCSESHLVFLTIDHVNNDGAEHRRSGVASGSSTYYWLRRNGYPTGFQVLCWNCQHAKAVGVACPHQAELEKACG